MDKLKRIFDKPITIFLYIVVFVQSIIIGVLIAYIRSIGELLEIATNVMKTL